MHVRHIKLMIDWGSDGLWWQGGDLVGNIDPRVLPISDTTREELVRWTNAYESTLNHDYPPDSAFPTKDDELRAEAHGRRLWQTLRDELGNGWRVDYYSWHEERLLPDPRFANGVNDLNP